MGTKRHLPRAVTGVLAAPGLPSPVEIWVAARSGRWVAVATSHRGTLTGIGSTPRDALAAALSPLGRQTVLELLASPGAFALSVQLASSEFREEAQ